MFRRLRRWIKKILGIKAKRPKQARDAKGRYASTKRDRLWSDPLARERIMREGLKLGVN